MASEQVLLVRRIKASSLAAHFACFAALGIAAVLIPTGRTAAAPPVIDLNLIALSVFIAPLGEELLFRWAPRYLCRRVPEWNDDRWMWIGALCFALTETLGNPQPLKFVSALLLGLALAYVYKRSGTLLAAIASHAGFNSGILLFVAVVSQYL